MASTELDDPPKPPVTPSPLPDTNPTTPHSLPPSSNTGSPRPPVTPVPNPTSPPRAQPVNCAREQPAAVLPPFASPTALQLASVRRKRKLEQDGYTPSEVAEIQSRAAAFDCAIALDQYDTLFPAQKKFAGIEDAVDRLLPWHIWQAPSEELDLPSPEREAADVKRSGEQVASLLKLRSRFAKVRQREGEHPSDLPSLIYMLRESTAQVREEINGLQSSLRTVKAQHDGILAEERRVREAEEAKERQRREAEAAKERQRVLEEERRKRAEMPAPPQHQATPQVGPTQSSPHAPVVTNTHSQPGTPQSGPSAAATTPVAPSVGQARPAAQTQPSQYSQSSAQPSGQPHTTPAAAQLPHTPTTPGSVQAAGVRPPQAPSAGSQAPPATQLPVPSTSAATQPVGHTPTRPVASPAPGSQGAPSAAAAANAATSPSTPATPPTRGRPRGRPRGSGRGGAHQTAHPHRTGTAANGAPQAPVQITVAMNQIPAFAQARIVILPNPENLKAPATIVRTSDDRKQVTLSIDLQACTQLQLQTLARLLNVQAKLPGAKPGGAATAGAQAGTSASSAAPAVTASSASATAPPSTTVPPTQPGAAAGASQPTTSAASKPTETGQ